MMVVQSYLLPCLGAFVACLGFAILYNIRGLGMFICSFGGSLGWLCYLLLEPSTGDLVAAFLAAIVISVYAEWMARVRRCPVLAYQLVALLPLVPGGGIYYSMEYAISGETQLFLDTLMHTVGIASALAVGVLTVATLVRLWGGIKPSYSPKGR